MNTENKVVAYLVLTAIMVATFICAIAISHSYYSGVAWLVLIGMNLGGLMYLMVRK